MITIKTKVCKDCDKEISSRAERCKSCSNIGERNPNYKKIPFNELIKEYTTKNISAIKLAKKYKVCTSNVIKKLKILGIKTRNRSKSMLRNKNSLGFKQSQETIEKKRLNANRMFGSNNPMFGKKRPEHKLNCKCCFCIIKRGEYRGKLNHAWKGGISSEPYTEEFTGKLKEIIRKRDNYTCQNCGLTNKDNVKIYKENLTVHHIDYNKKNSKENNLISLCKGCHTKSNGNRKYWTKHLQEIINDKN